MAVFSLVRERDISQLVQTGGRSTGATENKPLEWLREGTEKLKR
jgi:hypothetical protein